ncbi:NAD(P)/FAD-dependent oxidoreductase [Halioxenophilus aromaticivorans]|uniref:Tryptophan 7-halogenase n=1 Tax=Halioxenophilus aromaticivorans TaxID=1306992 RepID=A0AAV3U048_9ALTE
MAAGNPDVIIAGGGIAGLGLATQLIEQNPELKITLLERSRFPVNNVTAKVGESTVEIGSRYLSHTLGLKDHFASQHLQKFGLRCFFGSPQTDFSQQDELGVSRRFDLPTFQIERGLVENHLQQRLLAQGVTVLDGVDIESVELGQGTQQARFKDQHGQHQTLHSRWLIDAAGRQALVKNSLGLHKPSHHRGNAIWFRVDKTIKIDDWSNQTHWHDKIASCGQRWLSTNHLMGPGYWAWVIPLGSGATSIGLVMDDIAYEQAAISNYNEALAWLDQHQPHLAAALSDAKVLDFVNVRDYSYGCDKLFSSDGWALTGEAGVFADPFYSPGADFIALGNDIISHIISQQSNGQAINRDCNVLEFFFTNFFDNTVSVYRQQYGGFGDRQMMSVKLAWDYAFYWGVLVLLYYKNAVTSVQTIKRFIPDLQHVISLNQTMQALFRERAQQRRILTPQGMFIDQYELPVLHEIIGQLTDESLPLEQALPNSRRCLEQLMTYFTDMLSSNPTKAISDGERALLADYRHQVLA